MKNFSELLDVAQKQKPKSVVAVNGVDAHTLEALQDASSLGFIKTIVTGNREKIEESCQQSGINLADYEVVHAGTQQEATQKAIDLIRDHKADILMKGLIPTDKFMKAVLVQSNELIPKNEILTHIAVVQNSNYHKLLFFSDAAVIPYPDLEQKILMINYLIRLAKSLGIEKPKVAVIGPTEQIITSIPSCVDGAILAKMSARGKFQGATVDGPVSLGIAVNAETARIKQFSSPVAGDSDCLLFPNIDAANVFYKTNTKLAGAEASGIIAGAKVPIVVSSRGDNRKSKLNSLALAALMK